MKLKTSEDLIERLRPDLGAKLKAAVLYGSTASGVETHQGSAPNVLLVFSELDLSTLKLLSPILHAWGKAGNPAPVLFTEDHLKESRDVFPIEFLDLQESHRVLFGEDPFLNMEINPLNLRHQLEFELRGKLMQVRQRYVGAEGNPSQLSELLFRALSAASVLFKATLRLTHQPVPARKQDVWVELNRQVSIDVPGLEEINLLRENKKKLSSSQMDDLFARLLKSFEAVIGFVNKV